jgi:hypothetical protein
LYEYFKVRLKYILSITSITYNNDHADLEADLLNINYKTNLTTEEEVTSTYYKQTRSWIINLRTTTFQKDNFSFTILGPFRDQLTIEGKLINLNFLKPIETLEIIISKLSLDKLIKPLFNINRKNDSSTQATIELRDRVQAPIIKPLELLHLESSNKVKEPQPIEEVKEKLNEEKIHTKLVQMDWSGRKYTEHTMIEMLQEKRDN